MSNELIELWLEVMKVRETVLGFKDVKIEVQFKGDRRDPEPAWWPVTLESIGLAQRIYDALDKQRTVLGCLKRSPKDKNGMTLECTNIRIQYSGV